MNGVPTEIYRQRLYSWVANETSGNIVLSFFDFKDGAKYVDAQKDPAKLKEQIGREVARSPKAQTP